MTAQISEYLDANLVLFLEANSREEALEVMVEHLFQEGKVKDKKEFHDAILRREKLVSTGIGLGIAIPHAKLPGYDDFFIAIGLQKQGIHWDSLDGAPVRLIFMIGGPDDKQTEYLQILSKLTQSIKDEVRRKKLFQATSSQQIIDIFSSI